ncbi:MAG: hypothetical protein GWP08_04530 [Nitrospiraceae bacterium]|nr:hypothetical protein [Nitrospiraceae bacterium]
MRVHFARTLMLALAAAALVTAATHAAPDYWAKHIQKFEDKDKEQAPPENAILFIGSSSIVGWDLRKYLPNMTTINRGFGGSEIADSVFYADRIVIPYKPRQIVFYAGDNDIANGKTPLRVFEDYTAFVKKVHEALPGTPILFIAIKPSIARWNLVDKMREANRMVRACTETNPLLDYLDIDTPMIGEDGKPKAELLRDDGLHMTPEGYRMWTDLLMPHLVPEKT